MSDSGLKETSHKNKKIHKATLAGDAARVDQALASVPVALGLSYSRPLIHDHLEEIYSASEALLPGSVYPSVTIIRLRTLLNFHWSQSESQ